MAASTSASIEPRVPSTTWRTIGSTATVLATAQHQVGQPVDLDVEAGLHDGGRAVLLDDDGAIGTEPRRQVAPPIDREHTSPADRTPPARRRWGLQPGTLYAAQPGDLPVHELQHLAGAIGVAVYPLVLVVKGGGGNLGVKGNADWHADLVSLAQVADVHAAHEAHVLRGHPFCAE